MVEGFTTSSTTPKEILGGEYPRAHRNVTITGGALLAMGTVMGRTTNGGAAVGAAVAGNTGNGTIGSVTAQAGNKPGVYRIVAIEPGANAGTFRVEDPQGVFVGTAVVGVAFANQIGFTIADGATDFVAGDAFTVTIAIGSEVWKKSLAAAVDGSEEPAGILTQDVDTTLGDKLDAVWVSGEFNQNQLVFGTGHTAASTSWGLAQKNIYLRKPAGAA